MSTRKIPTCDNHDARDHLFFCDLRARRGARRSLRGRRHQAASRQSSSALLRRFVLGLDGHRHALLCDLFRRSLPALFAAVLSWEIRRFRFGRCDHVHQRALELLLLPHPQSLPRVSARAALWRDRNFSFPPAPPATRPDRRVVPAPVHSLSFLREYLGVSNLETKSAGKIGLTLPN